MGAKLRLPAQSWLDRFGAGHEEYLFVCPGCQSEHRIIAKWGATSGKTSPLWSFNGNLESPTFNPSLLVRWEFTEEKHGFSEKHVCHSFIRDGKIEFLSDCTHALAGKTVPMEDA